jgi:predicted nucleotidyltransferase
LPNTALRTIRRFARQVAARFQPDKIILFGSYAYGTPNADSDVDILVVMPCHSRIDQAVKIRWEFPVPFPMDLMVRTPNQMAVLLKDGDSFLTEIATKGKVLYEKSDSTVGAKSRKRLHTRQKNSAKRRQTS